jgi:hypothetical protein
MEKILCNTIYGDVSVLPGERLGVYNAAEREMGMDWPAQAHTMVGRKRLHHLRRCVEIVLGESIPGDFIEAGVWRGGASIMMRAVLEAYGVRDRRVFLADSFRGLPPPDPARYPRDAGLNLEGFPQLAVSVETVKENFRRYDLLDESVRFAEGLFSDTLAHVPSSSFAIVRLDGDLYESTIDSLDALYPRLSLGGFLIVDDIGGIPACRAAVNDYRVRHHITETIEMIDWTGAFWRKASPTG